VGYYTQVLGLGESPTDVVFTGDRGVYSEEGDYDITIGALDSFWRGAVRAPCHGAWYSCHLGPPSVFADSCHRCH
jgi:hypothetical protein